MLSLSYVTQVVSGRSPIDAGYHLRVWHRCMYCREFGINARQMVWPEEVSISEIKRQVQLGGGGRKAMELLLPLLSMLLITSSSKSGLDTSVLFK